MQAFEAVLESEVRGVKYTPSIDLTVDKVI